MRRQTTIQNMKTVLTTETVRANERLRIWTGSLVCCFPLDALPSFEGSLMVKHKEAIKLIYLTCVYID